MNRDARNSPATKSVPTAMQRANRAERYAAGKALRDRVPREQHGEWTAPKNRHDPVDLVIASSKGRVPELIPIRYGRMSVSPFTFYRGTALNMAADLAGTPITRIRTQVCGDCHLMNFGGFASPERRVIFDINDFDETLPGPWEWDVKRLVASVHVVARQRGFAPERINRLVTGASRAYRQRLAGYSTMLTLDLWQERTEVKDVVAHFPPKY